MIDVSPKSIYIEKSSPLYSKYLTKNSIYRYIQFDLPLKNFSLISTLFLLPFYPILLHLHPTFCLQPPPLPNPYLKANFTENRLTDIINLLAQNCPLDNVNNPFQLQLNCCSRIRGVRD